MRQAATAAPAKINAEVPPGHPLLRVVLERLFGVREALWLAPLVLPYRGPLAALFALSLVAAGTALIPPWLTKLVIDRGLMAHDKQALVTFALAPVRSRACRPCPRRRQFPAPSALFRKVAGRSAPGGGCPHPCTIATLAGTAEDRRTDEPARRRCRRGTAVHLRRLVNGGGSLLRLVGGLAMLFVLAPKLAVLALVLAPVELVFFARARPVTHTKARDVRKARGELASGLAETITGLGALRALNATQVASDKIELRQQGLISALLSAQMWNEVTRAVPMVLTALLRGVVFLFGGLAVIDGTMELGSLIAFTAYLGFLIGPMQSLISLWHGQARMKAALDRLDEIMSATPDVRDPPAPLPLSDYGGDLVLSGVSYAPPGKGPLFRDLNLTVPAGSKLRLSGPSGIGKSSLLSLLQRHDDPEAGSILLNGLDLRHLRLADIRGTVALVPQKGHVFSGTLTDNLRLGRPEASETEMLDVLRLVELDERFGIGPETSKSNTEETGYSLDTRLGEGGARSVRWRAPAPVPCPRPASAVQGVDPRRKPVGSRRRPHH